MENNEFKKFLLKIVHVIIWMTLEDFDFNILINELSMYYS